MLDPVRNPEDRFSHDTAQVEQCSFTLELCLEMLPAEEIRYVFDDI